VALTEPWDHLTVTFNLVVPSGDMGAHWCVDTDHLRKKISVIIVEGWWGWYI